MEVDASEEELLEAAIGFVNALRMLNGSGPIDSLVPGGSSFDDCPLARSAGNGWEFTEHEATRRPRSDDDLGDRIALPKKVSGFVHASDAGCFPELWL